MIEPRKIFLYRMLAGTFLQYACDGSTGRAETDPIYQIVVEGRDGPSPQTRAKYSSCGDLAHWLYFRLGVRAGFVNRAEHTGWVVGANLNRWVGKPIGPNPYAFKPSSSYDLGAGDAFAPGDVIVIDNAWGGHVMCVTAWEPGARILHTAEYGKPGGKLGRHLIEPARQGRNGLQLGSGNPIMALTRLAEVLEGELTRGTLADPDVAALTGWQAAEALDVFERELRVADLADPVADPPGVTRGED